MKINNLTKISLYVIISIVSYALLTIPNLTYYLTNGDYGFEYETDLLIIVGIWSALISAIITNFIIREIERKI